MSQPPRGKSDQTRKQRKPPLFETLQEEDCSSQARLRFGSLFHNEAEAESAPSDRRPSSPSPRRSAASAPRAPSTRRPAAPAAPAAPPPRSTTRKRTTQPHDRDPSSAVHRGHSYSELDADLYRVENLDVTLRPYRSSSRNLVQPWYNPPPALTDFLQTYAPVIATISLIIIVLLWPGGSPIRLTEWAGAGGPIGQIAAALQSLNPFGTPTLPPNPPGNYNLQGAPSLTAAQADEILASYGSPAVGSGHAWVELGQKYSIDPAFALAFFVQESTAGTHPNWAGHKDDNTTTHNVGNIICAGYPRCYGRFRDYATWEEGIEDWYRLIDREYIQGRGHQTIADVVPVYAPAFENDVDAYINSVEQLVDTWRMTYSGGIFNIDASRPDGNPLQAPNTVMTQGYGVGTHAPAEVWGAVDLAIDSTGDGVGDPDASWNHPVYAMHSGIVKVTPNSFPAGNHVWVINDMYKTGYSHLNAFAVQEGQFVERGTVIGYLGSTGQSSGPHLDYQIWQMQNGTWVNMNPLDYGALRPSH